MKTLNPLRLALAAVLTFGPIAFAATQNFDDMKPGQLPSGWEIGIAGGFTGGKRLPGTWERDMYGVEAAKKLQVQPKADFQIVASADGSKGNVLQGRSQGTDAWCVKRDVKIRDGYVEVRGKLAKEVPQHMYFMN